MLIVTELLCPGTGRLPFQQPAISMHQAYRRTESKMSRIMLTPDRTRKRKLPMEPNPPSPSKKRLQTTSQTQPRYTPGLAN